MTKNFRNALLAAAAGVAFITGGHAKENMEEMATMEQLRETIIMAGRERYRNRAFRPSVVVICNKSGVKKLIAMRIAQWEEWEEKKNIDQKNDPIINFGDPIPSFEEGCVRTETEVTYLEVAQEPEYSFPYRVNLIIDLDWQYPCPLDSDKRCINFYGPVVQYAKAEYLASDGNWYGNVFVEIGGHIRFIDHPDDIKEEGSNLGDMHANGEGVPEDDVEAARWRLATEQGDAEAQHSLGWMYDNGLGVPEDDVEAVRWYRMAAEQGYAKSQFNLGIMYAAGEGVPEDDVQAYVWLSLAAAQGIEPAEEMKQTISASMTGEAIASAQELSEKYRDAYGPVRILE